MGEKRLSHMVGLNIFKGAAAARLSVIYFLAGLGTGALYYYFRHILRREGGSKL